MVRKRYNRPRGSTTASWFEYGRVYWPVVMPATVREYVSVFQPIVLFPHGALQPSDLEMILRPMATPALYWARDRSGFLEDGEPQLRGEFPKEPGHPGNPPPTATAPTWERFAPPKLEQGLLATFLDVLSGAAGKREGEARAKFNQAEAEWKRESKNRERAEQTYRQALHRYERDIIDYRCQKSELEQELNDEIKRHKEQKQRLEALRTADMAKFNQMLERAASGSSEGIENLAKQALLSVVFPVDVSNLLAASYDSEGRILLYNINVPNIEEFRLYVKLKTKSRPASAKEVRSAQEFLVHAIALRAIYEVFATPELNRIDMVGVNLHLSYISKHNGKRMHEIIGSLAVTRNEFSNINIAEVDPKLCFRALKSVTAPSFQDLSPIRPILNFDRDDKRIVASREIVDGLDRDTNLAAMDWDDFEHIVRELFSKMFSARSAAAEVHVTRASRDYGVDALIHDPDPIHGGKFVIQAKRYVNTVEVAAVRDLFGTIQNEGANRGYLVTTSSFGPDAHAFAKGKPLTLIDGPHLLQLLKDHGYSFRINLREAKQILHGR
jgi:restriction system protein